MKHTCDEGKRHGFKEVVGMLTVLPLRRTLFFVLAALLMVLVHCKSKPIVRADLPHRDIRQENEGTLYEILNRKNFESRRSIQYDLTADTKAAAFTFLEMPQVVQCDLPWPEGKVLAIRIREDQHFHIDRFLLLGREFFFDNRDRLLMVQFDLPVIYFSGGPLSFKLIILGVDEVQKLTERTIWLTFNWKPMAKTPSGPLSFTYLSWSDLLDDDSAAGVITRELARSNADRWRPEVRHRFDKFLSGK